MAMIDTVVDVGGSCHGGTTTKCGCEHGNRVTREMEVGLGAKRESLES